MSNIVLSKTAYAAALQEGADAVLDVVLTAIQQASHDEITAETLTQLNGDQITLWAYIILRDEVMNGGFIQLIYNGYGPFIFDNPFAKAMRLWGFKDFSKFIYKVKELYDRHKADLTRECTDEAFMALFETYPQFDHFDDQFVEEEEDLTTAIAEYVKNHIDDFVNLMD